MLPVVPIEVDPAGRAPWRDEGEWRIWLGWTAALLLHGGLVAALLFSWASPPAPPVDRPAVSLVLLPPDQTVSVRPKPPGEAAILPAAPPVKIVASQPIEISEPAQMPTKPPSPPARIEVPLREAIAAPPRVAAAAPPRGLVEPRIVPQQDGDGFVAAAPVTGNFNQPPEYPIEAQTHGEQGDVLLSIHVLANGAADSVSVTQSSGYAVLDAAAAKAVWKWRFQPSMLSGQAVPSVIPYRIHFDLRGGPGAN